MTSASRAVAPLRRPMGVQLPTVAGPALSPKCFHTPPENSVGPAYATPGWPVPICDGPKLAHLSSRSRACFGAKKFTTIKVLSDGIRPTLLAGVFRFCTSIELLLFSLLVTCALSLVHVSYRAVVLSSCYIHPASLRASLPCARAYEIDTQNCIPRSSPSCATLRVSTELALRPLLSFDHVCSLVWLLPLEEEILVPRLPCCARGYPNPNQQSKHTLPNYAP